MILLLAIAGCVTLDWAVFNGVPCANVGPTTCEQVDNRWDKLCLPCEQPYDWAADYDWMPGTLDAGQSVRPIAPQTVDQLRLASTDGAATLDAYWVPPHGEHPDRARVTILYNHGNYGSIEHYLPRVRFLHEAGYGVLVWDYRGYGKTDAPSTPTPDQHLDDARLVAQATRARVGPDVSIVPYGYSLGAITAVEQAVTSGTCALVLEAPFTGLDNVARGNTATSFPSGFLYDGQYETDERVADFGGSLLVMSGDLDRNFPPDDVAGLVGNAGGATDWWLLPGVRHGVSDGGVPEAGLRAYHDRIAAVIQGACAD